MTKNRLAFEVLGAPQVEKSDLDKSRNFSALLAWKKGGAEEDQKNKKVKKGKYISMNPARFASHHRVVQVCSRRSAGARLKEEEEEEE